MAVIDNLVAYWSLDEASGNRADSHGSNTLTDNNTVGSATGKVSNAADFVPANSEYFSIADNAAISAGDVDFTLAAWVYADALGTAVIFRKSNGTDHEYMLRRDAGASNRFQFTVSETGSSAFSGEIEATTLGSSTTGVWYFVVAWHDATANTVNIQVNNGTANSAAYSLGVFNGSADLGIGAYIGTFDFWDGLIDEAAIWKKVLTSDERTWLYNSGSGRSYADIVAEGATGQPTAKRLGGILHAGGASPLGYRSW